MEESKAHKVQNTNGVKSNRNVPKEDYTGKHKRSTPKTVIDPRRIKIQLMLSHPKQSVQPLTVELWEVERVKKKYEGMGFSITVVN